MKTSTRDGGKHDNNGHSKKTAGVDSSLDNNNKQPHLKDQFSYRSFLILGLLFSISLLFLYAIYLHFPQLEEEEKALIKLPKNIADAKNIGIVLKKYNQDHFYSVLAAFFCIYVFLQTFAIPGSIFLSILSGFLYPFPMALTLVCTCSALGASFCYGISSLVARKIVLHYFHSRISEWQKKVNSIHGDLFWYIVFLRITPLVPNWFMNLSSPVINIPMKPFVLGTFVGVAPPSLIYIQAGTTLHTLTSSTSVFSIQSVLGLVLVSIFSLAPIVLPKLFPQLSLNKFFKSSSNKSD